jgi:hypothetical protein
VSVEFASTDYLDLLARLGMYDLDWGVSSGMALTNQGILKKIIGHRSFDVFLLERRVASAK